MITDQIISLKRGETQNSRSPLWIGTLASGRRANIFQHNNPSIDNFRLFEEAGYGKELLAMAFGETLRWRSQPIEIQMVEDGRYWKIVGVAMRPENAFPDRNFVPDPALYRPAVAAWAGDLLTLHHIVILDTETTGLENDDQILSIAILPTDRDDPFVRYVVPQHPERVAALESVHGLRYDSTRQEYHNTLTNEFFPAYPFESVYPLLRNNLVGKIWVIYNAAYDMRLLNVTCAAHGLEPIFPTASVCAMEMYAAFRSEWQEKYETFANCTLSEACDQMGIMITDAHNALSDARATYELIERLAAWKAEPF